MTLEEPHLRATRFQAFLGCSLAAAALGWLFLNGLVFPAMAFVSGLYDTWFGALLFAGLSALFALGSSTCVAGVTWITRGRCLGSTSAHAALQGFTLGSLVMVIYISLAGKVTPVTNLALSTATGGAYGAIVFHRIRSRLPDS